MESMEEEQQMQGDGSEYDIPMDDEIGDDDEIEIIPCNESGVELTDESLQQATTECRSELDTVKNDYLLLYAEFENYKKRVAKDKEGLLKYANESIIIDLLTSLDHLEIALKHARESEDMDAPKSGLMQGVDMTLRELLRTLEKFGVKQIDASGQAFDPEFHHAVSQVEIEDIAPGMVVEELRKGYLYNGKVIRATMVSVSKVPENSNDKDQERDNDVA